MNLLDVRSSAACRLVVGVAIALCLSVPCWAAEKQERTAATTGSFSTQMSQLRVGANADKTDVQPFLSDTRLVTFRWNDKRSFAIRALEGTYTNIELPDGETVEGFYLSDPDWEWHVTGDNRRIVIKPLSHGGVNTGTLVSNKRSYELTMVSVSLGEQWYQRVRWEIPGQGDNGMYWRGQIAKTSLGASGGAASDLPSLKDIDPDKLNFGYRVKGKADFRPETVFDDGTRTWIRLGKVQDLPAIFAKNERGLEVVDYHVQGPYVVVAMIAPEFVLRLRKTEVTIKGHRH